MSQSSSHGQSWAPLTNNNWSLHGMSCIQTGFYHWKFLCTTDKLWNKYTWNTIKSGVLIPTFLPELVLIQNALIPGTDPGIDTGFDTHLNVYVCKFVLVK